MSEDPDLDIYRAAKLLIDRHGADAALWADARVADLTEAGDDAGAAVWRAILRRSRNCSGSVGRMRS